MKVEPLTPAWNRFIAILKRTKPYKADHEHPVRMAGYTEVVSGRLDKKVRKQLDSALRRGYMLANGNLAASLIHLYTKAAGFSIGYIGKTKASLWFPTRDMRDRCRQLMEAQLVMTDKFCADDLRSIGDHIIRVKVSKKQGVAACAAHFTELRLVVDTFMAEWAAPREQYANLIADDDYMLRVPFDSYKEK